MNKLIKSNKGCDLFVHQNYIFRISNKNVSTISWRCIIKTCNASGTSPFNIFYSLNSFTLLKPHNHYFDLKLIEKKEKRYEMKELIRLTNGAPRTILSKTLENAPETTILNIGTEETNYKILRTYRNSILNPKTYVFEDLGLSSLLCKTHSNESFYQYGPQNYKNMEIYDDFVIFFSISACLHLKETSIWCIDATFLVVPNSYYQLLTISFIKSVHVFPRIFCIMKNKKEITYKNLFFVLKKMIGKIQTKYIKCDLELALINALQSSFKDTQ